LRKDAGAAQNVGATCIAGAEAAAAGALNILGQLSRGKCSRAENSAGHRCKSDALDCLTHGSSSLFR
jgi:hypothetical protein